MELEFVLTLGGNKALEQTVAEGKVIWDVAKKNKSMISWYLEQTGGWRNGLLNFRKAQDSQ